MYARGQHDILFLQATWLNKTDNVLLKDVDDNFEAFGISVMSDTNCYEIGRIHTCLYHVESR